MFAVLADQTRGLSHRQGTRRHKTVFLEPEELLMRSRFFFPVHTWGSELILLPLTQLCKQ